MRYAATTLHRTGAVAPTPGARRDSVWRTLRVESVSDVWHRVALRHTAQAIAHIYQSGTHSHNQPSCCRYHCSGGEAVHWHESGAVGSNRSWVCMFPSIYGVVHSILVGVLPCIILASIP